ncbi:MAG: hypothetical protein OEY89_14110 [Gammaproteobacteria bacterium]|nr:hypothetical protein [Gammaproteobacteria bacterium]
MKQMMKPVAKQRMIFIIMMTNASTNMKSIHDQVITETTKWSEAQEELRSINRGVSRGLAYVKFQLASNYG